jgi:hypothetical protein
LTELLLKRNIGKLNPSGLPFYALALWKGTPDYIEIASMRDRAPKQKDGRAKIIWVFKSVPMGEMDAAGPQRLPDILNLQPDS